MTEAENIELAILGRLHRRIATLEKQAAEIADAQSEPMRRQLREGERRGLVCAGVIIADEFAAKICGENPFDNPVFNGEMML